MVLLAYIAALVSASPQAFIFRVLKHPEKDFYQCTTLYFFSNLTTALNPRNITDQELLGLSPVQWEDLYHTIFNCEVFFVPVCVIVASYAKIYIALKGQVDDKIDYIL